jgi:DNA-binding LacI/PurR family transcriptional regulator
VLYPVDSTPVEPLVKLIRSGYPIVLADRYLRGVASDYVMSDHFGGALRATQHLIQLGHERIGFISWIDPAVSLEHRAAGYQRALMEAGLPSDPTIVCTVEGYPVVSIDPIRIFLSEHPEITAIFAANDQIALGVYRAARQIGKSIPYNIAIVGFDDLDFTSHLDVPLTTVAQAVHDIGRTAVQLLIRRIRQPLEEWQQAVLPTRLVIRRSCGAYLKATIPTAHETI